jgi:5-methylcytosine-specific restriction endonuclease McrA
MTRTCSKCGEAKASADFYRTSGSKHRDGLKKECKDCWNAARRARYAAKREGELAANAAWREENREHHDRLRRKWKRQNPDRVLTHSHTRRLRIASQFVEHVDPNVVYERNGGLCGICGEPVERAAMEVDHIIPVSRGGLHGYSNVQPAHGPCNRRKHNHITEAAA